MIQDPNAPKQRIPWPVINEANLGDNYGPGPQIRVRYTAIRPMYYNFHRRREGDVFTLIPMYVPEVDQETFKPIMEKGQIKKRLVTAEEQFNAANMERLDDDEQPHISTAQEALNRTQNELNEAKAPRPRK